MLSECCVVLGELRCGCQLLLGLTFIASRSRHISFYSLSTFVSVGSLDIGIVIVQSCGGQWRCWRRHHHPPILFGIFRRWRCVVPSSLASPPPPSPPPSIRLVYHTLEVLRRCFGCQHHHHHHHFRVELFGDGVALFLPHHHRPL